MAEFLSDLKGHEISGLTIASSKASQARDRLDEVLKEKKRFKELQI